MTTRLNPTQYNIGALSGSYALKDMSNTGKFANTLQSLPCRTNIEINAELGELVLKAGSVVTVPSGMINGVPYEIYERLAVDSVISNLGRIEDYTITSISTDKQYLIYNTYSGTLELVTDEECMYVTADEEDEGGTIIREQHTFIKKNNNRARYALPLGYFDDAMHWHGFTSIGFYKDFMWVDRGTSYLIPCGRTETYVLDVLTVEVNKLSISTLDEVVAESDITTTTSGYLMLDTLGNAKMVKNYNSSATYEIQDGYIYVSSENKIYNNQHEEKRICKVSDLKVEKKDGVLKFNEILNYNVFQTLDFSEVMGGLTDLKNTAVHLDGRPEVIRGEKSFVDTTTMSDAIIDGLNVNTVNVSNLNLTNGTTDINRVYIKNTNDANSLNIVGKDDNKIATILFGEGNNPVRITGNRGTAAITFDLPTTVEDTTPALLPAVGNAYNLGSDGYKFNTVYANSFEGVATKARWADLAEMYKTDEKYPIGTLLQFGGKEELTIAHSEVNAVISERPAVLMNSEMEGQPVALAGRVKVRVRGVIKKHDKIFLSQTDGIGTNIGLLNEQPIARALEDKPFEEEGLVLCAVHFNI